MGGVWVMDLREGGSGTDRCLGEKRKEQKEKPTLKWGALKRGAQTGVWVGCPYLFQPLYYGWFILGYPPGYFNLPSN